MLFSPHELPNIHDISLIWVFNCFIPLILCFFRNRAHLSSRFEYVVFRRESVNRCIIFCFYHFLPSNITKTLSSWISYAVYINSIFAAVSIIHATVSYKNVPIPSLPFVTNTRRRYGGERCQGFTMFRHPIPRVVSAYFYCKKAPEDPLCATSVMRAKNVDLLTFVQHWGNFGLRSVIALLRSR